MDVDSELIKAGTSMGTQIVKESAQSIFERIKIAKASKSKDEVIGELQEIITDLIEQRNQLVQTTQLYEEKLIAQKITDEEVDYIIKSLVPLVENLVEMNEGDKDKARETIEAIKPILSKETLNILQLIGFNFKQGIGEPLTQLVKSLISSKSPDSQKHMLEYQMLIERREIEYLKLLQDESSYQRFKEHYRQENIE